MKVAVVGSRTFDDPKYMASILRHYDITVLISGGAKGADYYGKQYALEHKIQYREYPADWDKFGKRAGFLRNKQIVDDCEMVIAFWDGESKGTAHTIRLAKEAGKEVIVCWPDVNFLLNQIGTE